LLDYETTGNDLLWPRRQYYPGRSPEPGAVAGAPAVSSLGASRAPIRRRNRLSISSAETGARRFAG